jgi:hypothetical protein
MITRENIVDLYAVGVVVCWALLVVHVRREAKIARGWWLDDVHPAVAQYEYLRGQVVGGFLTSFLWPVLVAIGAPIAIVVLINFATQRQFMKSYTTTEDKR